MEKIKLDVATYDRKVILNKESIKQIEDTLNKFIDAGLWHFKGVVPTKEDLPIVAEKGDVWHVQQHSSEWAFTGDGEFRGWTELGSIIDLSEYAKIIDVSNALNLKADKSELANLVDSQFGVKHIWKGTEAELPATRQDDTLYIVL